MKKAYKIGNLYAKHILELDNEVKHFKGGSFKSFFKGLKKGFHKVAPIASTVATLTGNPEIGLAVEGTDVLLGNGANNELSPEILDSLNTYNNDLTSSLYASDSDSDAVALHSAHGSCCVLEDWMITNSHTTPFTVYIQ